MLPYLPATVLYPPIGVEEKALECPRVGTTLPLRYKEINLVQFLNAYWYMLFGDDMLTVLSDVQPENALLPIIVSVAGRDTVVRLVHPANAKEPIDAALGIDNATSLVQL